MSEARMTTSTPKPWLSRVFVIAMFAWILAFGVGALIFSLIRQPGEKEIVSPFKPWDGVWEGEFVALKSTGEIVRRVRVRQEWRHIAASKDFRQEGHFMVTDAATGVAEEEKALHKCAFDLTGLERRVIKRNGGVVIELDGRQEGGRIVWSRSIPGATETFREWIDGDTYHVEGEGAYGEAGAEQLTYVGLYRRVGQTIAATPAQN